MTVPDNDKLNQEQFLELLRVADPELYLIKQALLETRINPLIIPQIVRVMGNLLLGTGFGKIEIYMQSRVIKNIVGQEKVMIEQNAEVDI